jgi:hypothetical protein
MNILSPEFKELQFYIITCTLFCHHFKDNELVSLFRQLRKQVRLGIVVNDIHRHWFAYHSINFLTYFFSRSFMVRNDAKLSVLRSFKRKELAVFLEQAGFKKINIAWKWAFRFQVVGWK